MFWHQKFNKGVEADGVTEKVHGALLQIPHRNMGQNENYGDPNLVLGWSVNKLIRSNQL